MPSRLIVILMTPFLVFSHELEDGLVSRRDTTMTFMTFVNCDLFNAYVCRSADKCFYDIPIFGVSDCDRLQMAVTAQSMVLTFYFHRLSRY